MQPSVPDAYPRADGPTPHRRHRGAAGRHHPPYAHRRGRFAPLAGALGGAAGGARQGRQRDRHAAHDPGAGSHLAPPRGAAARRPACARDRPRSRPDGHGEPAAGRWAGGDRARSAPLRAADAGRAGGGGRWALRTGAGGTGVQADGRWGGWGGGRGAAPPAPAPPPRARPPATAELTVVMVDVRTGRVGFRTVARGEGDDPWTALTGAVKSLDRKSTRLNSSHVSES